MGRSLGQTPDGVVFHVLSRQAMRLPLFERSTDYEAFERVLIEAMERPTAPRTIGAMRIPRDTPLGRIVSDALLDRCGPETRVLAVYRFGSTVSGVVHPASDLDLAVLARRELDAVGLFDAAQDVASHVGCDVDLVDLRRADGTLRAQVIGTGVRILVENEASSDRFAAEALADYAWFNEIRGAAVERFLERYRDPSRSPAQDPSHDPHRTGAGHGR
jgi:predicted nucleotidyltransferase